MSNLSFWIHDFSIHEISPELPLQSKQVFAFNADPDENEESINDLDEVSDDDYNPGSVEAAYCFEVKCYLLSFWLRVSFE